MWWIIQNWERRLGAWTETDVNIPVSLPRDDFDGPTSLGTVYGHCLETSSLHLLLKSISRRLREITFPIHDNTSDFCDGNMSSRGWNDVIESLVIQEMALFPNIFRALGKKDCLFLRLCHIPAVLLFESPIPPLAAPCWTSISLSSSMIIFKGCFS